MLKIGQPAPDFTLLDDTGASVSLSSFRGKKVVVYFYPKDDTPGCTKEACAFRDGIAELKTRGAVVLGVSTDSVESHRKFKVKYRLNFPLLSDDRGGTLHAAEEVSQRAGAATEQKTVSRAYGVWKQKSLYGRTYMGIERTTFLLDEQGRIARIFPKVKVEGHGDEVLASL